ncbi:APA family fibronectin-binding glycoprotein [Mycolicibacterium mengxianglii]|uniref:APA family fibronectin-binding glycoprotein n=1 Tax=Mycolicibacterium mengxianglii TaxID=2736649 RepID=UPI0018EF070E|nr:APA family fibronectin-binding glycoprotein [Mycolicibacterium mengxianglii]
MDEPEQSVKRHRGKWGSAALAAAAGASALALVLPAAIGHAEPAPPPPTPTVAPPPAADPNAAPPAVVDPSLPAPADPGAPPPPADPNAAPPPADPNAPPAPPAPPAPEPGRVDNAAGGFSYVLPPGWVAGDATRLNYGQALLVKETPAATTGEPAAVANDTSILLGRLDLKLFAGAEPDNAKAATRLASDMGEFFMPFAGTRVNQETIPLDANGMPGSASYYEVKFTDTAKPDGQIWAGVVGTQAVNAPRGQRNERWFMVWLGTAKDPIDKGAAAALANSIRPWSPPPPPAPDPNAPVPPADPNAAPADPNAPPPVPRNQVGVPVPVTTPVPEMMPPPA